MTFNCDYCKKDFSNKYILRNHQKTAKYCLRIQNKPLEEEHVCENCESVFTQKTHLKTHMKTCRATNNIKQVQKRHKKQIHTLRKQLQQQEAKYERKIEKIQTQYERKIEKLQDRIQELATKAIAKPTTTNNTTNVLNLTPFDMDAKCIKDKIQEKYDFGYFLKGQRGVAEFTKENLLTDKEGNLMYICCDPSRSIFKYKDEKGELRKDVQANRLSKTVTPSILSKAHSLVMEEVENGEEESEEEKNKKNMKHYEMYFKLKEFEDKPQKFGVELSKLVS